VTIWLSVLDSSHPIYFYKMKVKDKLEHVQALKATATRFFKASELANNYKKAADLYQKINGYYNFGDSTHNYAKEDEEDEEFKKANEELRSIKLLTFGNLVVCKHKMQEWNSVIGITDQILSETMDPKNIKAYYFRTHAQLNLGLYEEAVKTVEALLEIDPTHAEAKKLLGRAKDERQKYRERETAKYAKLFK
jgi:tetratricopeptide (TPR) repeat protein